MQSQVVVRASELASAQWGLFTSAQAQDDGLTRMQLTRMVEAGILDRLERGVYATPSVQGDPLLSLRSAWLSLQPRRTAEERLSDLPTAGVVSHASAARLHGIGDLLADEHELLLPERFQSSRSGVRVRRAVLPAADVTLVSGLPTTTASRTVADLIRDGHDLDHVSAVAADALRQGLVDRTTLEMALDRVAPKQYAKDGQELAARLVGVTGLSPEQLSAVAFERVMASHEISDSVRNMLRVLSDPEVQRVMRGAQERIGTALEPALRGLRGLSAAIEPTFRVIQKFSTEAQRWVEAPENRDSVDRLRAVLDALVAASLLEGQEQEQDADAAGSGRGLAPDQSAVIESRGDAT